MREIRAMRYSVRPFIRSDATALSQLTHAAISTIGLVRYSSDQTAAWRARHPGAERFLERTSKGDLIWVAVTQGNLPVAYALLEPVDDDKNAHLDMLYCHPDHTRKGLADQLLDTAEQFAQSNGAARLYSEASELARSTFERAGYVVTHRRDFTIEHNGAEVPIHNYAMEKQLR